MTTRDSITGSEWGWMATRAARAAGRPVTDLQLLPGGLSSITLGARLGGAAGEPIVLKLAPPGLDPVRNRDVLRQARVLAALAGVDGVAVPQVLFSDDARPPFFAMNFVEGDSFEPVTSDHSLPPPDELEARGKAASAMLARLHAVRPEAIGLGREPVGDLLAEVARWERALDTVDDDLRPGHRACAAALRAALPDPVAPAILHGDWRLGNMLCRGGSVEAVIDWEIWSVGDPRVDLAWFLTNSVSEGNPFATRDAPGMPGRPELLAAYEAQARVSLGDLAWFDALIEMKEAATMGLILKRNRRQAAPDASIEASAPLLPRLLEQALARLGALRPGPDPEFQEAVHAH